MRRLLPSFTALCLCAAIAACGGDGKPALELPEPLTEAEKAALVASLPSPYHEANLVNGQEKFAQCKSCHTITPDGKNLTGPNLFGVFGRQAAARPDFEYSDALKESGIVWDAAHLDGWLAGPRTYLRKTKMSFSGIRDANDRRDVIVYLMAETGYRTPELSGAAPAN